MKSACCYVDKTDRAVTRSSDRVEGPHRGLAAYASEREYGTMPRWWPVLPIAAVALLINISFFDAGIQYLAARCAPAGEAGAGTLCVPLEHLSAYLPSVQGSFYKALSSQGGLAEHQRMSMAAEDAYWRAGAAVADASENGDQMRPGCEVFIGIVSRPGARREREAIRRTWLRDVIEAKGEDRVRYRFFIGQPPPKQVKTGQGVSAIVTEDIGRDAGEWRGGEEADVVRLPFVDTYYNLSIKTAHVLRHAEMSGDHMEARTASEAPCRWLAKCDDDVYVHVPALVDILQALPDPDWPVYAGRILRSQPPVRDPTSKWHIPASDYEHESFPPYAEGPLYVLSSGLAQDLPFTMEKHGDEVLPSTYFDKGPRSSLFRFEDVFTGELIRRLPYQPQSLNLPRIYVHANATRQSVPAPAPAETKADKDKGDAEASKSKGVKVEERAGHGKREAKSKLDEKTGHEKGAKVESVKAHAKGHKKGKGKGEGKKAEHAHGHALGASRSPISDRVRARRRVAAVHGLGPQDMVRMHHEVGVRGELPTGTYIEEEEDAHAL